MFLNDIPVGLAVYRFGSGYDRVDVRVDLTLKWKVTDTDQQVDCLQGPVQLPWWLNA